jgi:hypothetical protein
VAHKRAEYPSALEETFGQALWLGQETGHNNVGIANCKSAIANLKFEVVPAEQIS